MRIVQVVHGFPPENLGGTETYAAQISAALRQRGHSVHIFTRGNDAHLPEYTVEQVVRDGLPITRVNNTFRRLGNFTQSYDKPEITHQFGAFLEKTVPDVIHFHHLMYLSTGCVQEAAQRGIPTVMTLHDYWLICQRGRFLKPDLSLCAGQSDDGCARCFAHLLAGKLTPVYQRFKPAPGTRLWARDLLRWAHAKYVARRPAPAHARQQIRRRMQHIHALCQQISLFLAPSRFLREQFIAFGIPPEKIVFSECGLPPLCQTKTEIETGIGRRDGDRDKKRVEGDGLCLPSRSYPASGPEPSEKMSSTESRKKLRFGYIGVVDPVKGIHQLVEAFEPLTMAELRIYGGETDYAPYPDRGKFLAQLRRSPHIHMMGRYEHHDLGRILNEVDVVVVPSIWYENAPLVIREAFLAKKPVVTASFGGMPEWIQDGVNGLLFRPRDVVDLRRTLTRLIADPSLARRLTEHFPAVQSIAADAAAIEGYYRSLLGCSDG
jgi:glycosyltransferase involved in cell wall biosynthesis